MAFRFVVLLATMMVAGAIAFPGAILQPTILAKTLEPAYAPAKYSFSYQVNDPTTGDIKSQEETRDGDVVKGSYTLIDADGLQRVVHYTSDSINGFNAIVSRTPLNKQIAVKAIQPALITAPLSKISNSPFGLPLSPLKLGPLY